MSSSALENKVRESLLNLNREKSLKDLFTYLVQIYNQHDLHKLSDRHNSELKYQPIATIICSEGLV